MANLKGGFHRADPHLVGIFPEIIILEQYEYLINKEGMKERLEKEEQNIPGA